MLGVLLHVFHHELFDCSLQLLHSLLDPYIFLVDVYKIDILWRNRVWIGELSEELQETVPLDWLALFQFLFSQGLVCFWFEYIIIKGKVVDDMQPQEHIFIELFSHFDDNVIEWELLEVFVLFDINVFYYLPISAVDFILRNSSFNVSYSVTYEGSIEDLEYFRPIDAWLLRLTNSIRLNLRPSY